jgi:acyl-CoA reductase-like NAD-dependent aldehyde dehydrogenase
VSPTDQLGADVQDVMSGVQDALFIGGNLTPAHSADRIPVVNPATEQRFASIPDADSADVDKAVRSAQEALRTSGWAQLSPSERAPYLRRLADILESRKDELGRLVTAENGSLLATSAWAQGTATAGYYRYFASLADELEVETAGSARASGTVVRREPVGVTALIVPWNGPQGAIAWKLGPALAAGCAAVVKPAPETSLDAYILADAVVAAGIPAGVVNIITGGREAGANLVSHPVVSKVAFTGSTAAGRKVALACAESFKRVTLELGGKSAAILLGDVDLAAFAPFVATACSPFSGQVCRALTRILAPRDRYDEVVDVVVEALGSLTVGDPTDARTQLGPLVSARQRERVEGYIASGLDEGAKLALGGGRPAGLERGYYVEPTVFRDADNAMRIAQEEIFGPVLTVIAYDDDDDAVRIANDSAYGLGGAVFTSDAERGFGLARRIASGSVGVNHYALAIDAPFGGVKQSGIGRELGPGALDAYLETKSIYRPPA